MSIYHLLPLLVLISVQILFCETYETYLIKNVQFNANQFKRHKTEKFYWERKGDSKVIVRRAGYLELNVELEEPYNGEEIEVSLSFHTRYFEPLVIRLPLDSEESGWSLNQFGDGNQITAQIFIPGSAPVGVWKLKVVLKNSNGDPAVKLELPHKIVVLFNPWSRADAAYFPDTEKLDEYVLNDMGIMYVMQHQWGWSGRPWIFGQFQAKVLEAILLVLDTSELAPEDRGDIVRVSRELTHLLNDDGGNDPGVLRGKWQEPYHEIDGRPATNPSYWTGSPLIFKKFYENQGKPVGYGQCWVFGGILTTALRALGIASRPITNFKSAHSIDRDLTVDIYLDDQGRVQHRELVWNYHVWVQAWFSRKSDLGDEYSGWQELDATPQERSSGFYQVGPASNTALRKSELTKPFENAFVYEELNADEVIWGPGNKILSVYTHSVGVELVTKQYRGSYAEEITRMYKPHENTHEERKSYNAAARALGITPRIQISPRSSKRHIAMEIQTSEETMIGSPVATKISFHNSTVKRLEVEITATAMYYNGKEAEELKSKTQKIKMADLNSQTIEFEIKPEDYIGKLREGYSIRIQAVARSGKLFAFQEKTISLKTPELIVNAPKTVEINETFTLEVEIWNPFTQPLSNCRISFEGTRIERKVVEVEDIAGSSVRKVTLEVKSTYANTETIVVQFGSGNLLQMEGSTQFHVNGKQSYHFANYVIVTGNRNENEIITEYNEIFPRTSNRVPTIGEGSFVIGNVTTVDL